MSYTLRVVFDGVCAYVPNKQFFFDEYNKQKQEEEKEKHKKAKDPLAARCDKASTEPVHPAAYQQKWCAADQVDSLSILLPDLRRPAKPSLPRGSRLNFPAFREPHFPLLTFRLGDLREGTTRRVDLVARDISEQDERGMLFLRQEQIRFSLKAENASCFSFAKWIPRNPFQPLPELDRPEQTESLWWLSDLARIVEGSSEATEAKSEVLPSYRGPFPKGLVARVECTGGRLRTHDFNRNVDNIPLAWRFARPDDAWGEGSWNRALANSVALEFFDVQSEVKIELRRLANEVVIEHLVLAPAPGASRPVLEISISNREPDLLFQEEGFGRLTLPDLDFQPFYEKLSSFRGNVSDLPIPHPARASFFGIREKPCAGTVMTPGGGNSGT
jgi:hypothetical protein